ncbi:TIGR02221 family CRISPR-associated protein [Hydrogenobaculum acidophilum]
MAKILMGIIGGGKYQITRYSFEGQEFETNYVIDALKEVIKPDRIFIIGTESSNWGLVDEKLSSYEKLIVPLGANEQDFWEMFRIITSIDVKEEDELYVDITHGFRSIPLFINTALSFLSKIKSVKIKAIYYGAYEVKDDIKPIIDIYPIIELNDWIEAFSVYKEYKDASKFSGLLEKKSKDASKYQKMLQTYSALFGFTAINQYIEYSKNISEEFEKMSLEPSLKAIEFLKEDLKRISNMFSHEKPYENYLELAELYYKSNRFHQSLVVLTQTIVECALNKLGIVLEDSNRINLESLIVKHLQNQSIVTKDMADLMNQISTLRNSVSHAFMGRVVNPPTIKKYKEDIKTFIQKAKNLIKEDFITDKEHFKENIFKEIKNTLNQQTPQTKEA